MAATGWRSRRTRSRWPTSSAPSRARSPACAGSRPEELEYKGAAEPLQHVWIALRSSLRAVLEHVTLADVVGDKLPKDVERLTKAPEAWV